MMLSCGTEPSQLDLEWASAAGCPPASAGCRHVAWWTALRRPRRLASRLKALTHITCHNCHSPSSCRDVLTRSTRYRRIASRAGLTLLRRNASRAPQHRAGNRRRTEQASSMISRTAWWAPRRVAYPPWVNRVSTDQQPPIRSHRRLPERPDMPRSLTQVGKSSRAPARSQ